jgi:hypothetical protein
VKSGTTKPVRCAIYTRVSTDHGLEQDFNSLDAQHDAAQAYIRSQAHAGWTRRPSPEPDLSGLPSEHAHRTGQS